jgi:hypothetical protein
MDDPTLRSGPHGPDDVPSTGADAPQPRLARRQAPDAVEALDAGPDQPTGTGRVDAAAAVHGDDLPTPGGMDAGMTDLAPEADRTDGPGTTAPER